MVLVEDTFGYGLWVGECKCVVVDEIDIDSRVFQ